MSREGGPYDFAREMAECRYDYDPRDNNEYDYISERDDEPDEEEDGDDE